MKLTENLHLNKKNGFTLVAGACIVGLTVIPLFVPAEKLSWVRWEIAVVCLMAAALAALFIQSLLQSSDDHKQTVKDVARDARQESLESKIGEVLAQLKNGPAQPVTEIPKLEPPPTETQRSVIDGELYRLATAPRTMSWELVRDLYKVSGRPGEAAVDCDVLVEMYFVNLSSQPKYVREIRLSAEVAGTRVNFEMMRDLLAMDISNHKYEYALEKGGDFYTPEEPLKPLMPQIPLSLTPEQPAEGWVRFMAKEINPDTIDRKTWQISVVDSTGSEHFVSRVSKRPIVGKIGLRGL